MGYHNDYTCFTRKQANILYTNVKRGKINMTRKDISNMYNIVGVRDCNDDRRYIYERVISAIFDDKFDIAQSILDGETWYRGEIETGEICTYKRFSRFAQIARKNGKLNEYCKKHNKVVDENNCITVVEKVRALAWIHYDANGNAIETIFLDEQYN